MSSDLPYSKVTSFDQENSEYDFCEPVCSALPSTPKIASSVSTDSSVPLPRHCIRPGSGRRPRSWSACFSRAAVHFRSRATLPRTSECNLIPFTFSARRSCLPEVTAPQEQHGDSEGQQERRFPFSTTNRTPVARPDIRFNEMRHILQAFSIC